MYAPVTGRRHTRGVTRDGGRGGEAGGAVHVTGAVPSVGAPAGHGEDQSQAIRADDNYDNQDQVVEVNLVSRHHFFVFSQSK